MFKQLRRRMLLLNLSILTILLISVFATIYISSYKSVQDSIDKDLSFIIDKTNDFYPFDGPLPDPNPGDVVPQRTIGFVIVTDIDGTILFTDVNFEISDTFLEDALSLAENAKGKIVLDGSDWAYQVKAYTDQIVYGYLDITSQQGVLSNLVTTFIIVFLASFVVVYLISFYITNKSVAKIKEAFIKQKQFVSNASHEIKTPLAIINTNVDVLQSRIVDDENKKWLNYIRYETDRMNKLTRDLLYLTKVSEQKSLEIIKERLNLSEITESIILSFEALAYEKNIAIDYELAPEVFIEFAREQYSQVIHILMDNAIKYTPKDGKISVNLTATHNAITLSVRNTGDGISKDDINNIFDRFYMVDKARSANPNSYGLGLSIAKSIIDNHGGKIHCESIEGEATTFFVKFKIKHV